MQRVATSPRRLVIDGVAISVAFSVIVILSLWIDPRLWLPDYPPDIRAAVGEGVRAPPVLATIVGILLMGILIGGLLYSNRGLARDLGVRFGFRAAFVHTLGIMVIVNAWDVVMLDWVFFVIIQPAFVVFPGTEGMAGYSDYGYHLRESFLQPRVWVGMLLGATVIAWGAHRLWGRA